MGFLGKVVNNIAAQVNEAVTEKANEKADYQKWKSFVAAIEAEERRLEFEQKPGQCRLVAYFWQQWLMCFESGLRIVFHVLMALASLPVYCLSWCFWSKAHAQCYHHWGMMRIYVCMPPWLCSNICDPHDPHYVYTEEVHIRRPPAPPGVPLDKQANDWCDSMFGCFNNAACCGKCLFCDCEDAIPSVNRLIRNAFLVLTGPHSCHPNAVCGPCCDCYEAGEQRFQRWENEKQERIDQVTNQFYAAYNKTHNTNWVPPTRFDASGTPFMGYYKEQFQHPGQSSGRSQQPPQPVDGPMSRV
eukprot:GFYU01020626.1.p1 GENE.GFYU01020626.1~~GFYU01020626.1.p1  ORF type:complete len:300 (-),score=65.02 GFYU01020626.1:227-1126(-)